MNYKLLIITSFILLVLSLASASASDVDQSALHDASLDAHIDLSLHDSAIAEGIASDSSDIDKIVPDSSDIDKIVPDSSDIDKIVPDSSIDDDGASSADAVDDGSADIDDKDIPADEKITPSQDDSNIPVDSDITDDDSIISNITNDTVKPKYNDEPISNVKESSGSFDDLQSLIDLMPAGSTLVLSRDYKGAAYKEIKINKDICIDGDGHTIDCAGVTRAIFSKSGNIVLKNLRIINGYYNTPQFDDKTNNGGAIWIEGTAAYTLINCSFIKNWADDMGGAIYNDAKNLLKIINCTFDSNEVDDVDGGAIYSKGQIYVVNSIFKGNKAYKNGGAIYYDANNLFKIINCTFDSNEVKDEDGGAIYSKGEVYVENSTFKGNKARSSGGAIELSKNDASALSEIINSIFISNTIKLKFGGAIDCNHNLFVDRSTFTSNGDSASYGGAIYSSLSSIIQNSLFQGNKADEGGGAIRVHDASLSNCTFISNKVDSLMNDIRGGAIKSTGDLYIDNCTFDKNWADDIGGAIYACGNLYINYYQADDGIYNTFFNENTADDDYGGAIHCEGNVHIKNTKFFANKAYTDGGAIYVEGDSHITHCLFDSNRCYDASSYCQGGAIYGEKTLHIMDCIFKDNYAEDDGGAIYSDGTVNIENSTFKENSAEDYGGAIYAKTVNINKLNEACKSFFINNHAKDDKGGAIYASDSVYAYNTDFSDNSALVDGGAIWAKNVNVNKCSFDKNRAEGAKSKCYGGAIRAGEAKVSNCIFNDNFSENHGGAIFTDTFSDAVKYCTFNKNQAKEDGGAVYINNKNTVTFTQCVFSNNKAGDEGGAIYLDSTSSTIKILNNLFDGNSASDGHAVFNKGSYGDILNNWWGNKNPTSSNNVLVEWCFWTSNKNHVDSDPLKAVLSCEGYANVGQVGRLTLHFLKSNGADFTGEIPVVCEFAFPLGYRVVGSGKTSNSAYADFIPSEEGKGHISATLLNQVYDVEIIVNDNLNIKENNADSGIVKNVIAGTGASKSLVDFRGYGLKVVSSNLSLNDRPTLGHFDDRVVFDKSLFNPVKTANIHESNGDFSIYSILLSILAIFGF